MKIEIKLIPDGLDLAKEIQDGMPIDRMVGAGGDEGESCPAATQDIELNLENRQDAIDNHNYGPLNPNLDDTSKNDSFWQKIADTTGLLLAADENLVNEKQVEGLLMNAAVGALILKPSILGGASGTRSIAELAAENKLRVIISSFLDGPIALRAARDLAIELAPKEIHGLGTAGLFVERFPKDVTPDQGYLHRS